MPREPGATPRRKDEHLRVNLEEDVASALTSGFELYRFEHVALPEIDLDSVDTAAEVFGRRLRAPLLVSCMTGGTPAASEINARLAEAAQERRIALGLGSARALLEDASAPGFDVRRRAPDVLLFANLGAVQLNRGAGVESCRRLLDLTGADALVLHLNPLQEALQPGGDHAFAGLLRLIERVCAGVGAPVVVKEVGFGISAAVARRLADAGVAAIDVAGAGGTSWSEVESHRLDPGRAEVAREFRGWGIPTAEALVEVRRDLPATPVYASGGIASGLDAAKAIALGAELAGAAGPFLRAAASAARGAAELAERWEAVLRLAMFATASPTLAEFRSGSRLRRRSSGAG